MAVGDVDVVDDEACVADYLRGEVFHAAGVFVAVFPPERGGGEPGVADHGHAVGEGGGEAAPGDEAELWGDGHEKIRRFGLKRLGCD